MQVLENSLFRAEINEMGAELSSLRSKATGTEYVWQGDPRRGSATRPCCSRSSGGSRTRPTPCPAGV